MSTPGSVRSGEQSQYTPPAGATGGAAATKPKRTRIFRWEGIIPLALVVALLCLGWIFLAGRIIRSVIVEAGTKALGAQLDIAKVDVGLLSSSLTIDSIALADPFDRTRNLFEVRQVHVALEPEPLFEKKVVITRFSISDIRTGTKRVTPAEPVTGGGFAPRALNEVQRFAGQFKVPLLSLTPFDTLKSLVLDPTQLRAVQAAIALGGGADSVKQSIEAGYASLRLQETLDSSAALVARMQNVNVRTMGLDGARKAVSDLRAGIARVEAEKARVDALVGDARRGVDTLQARLKAIDAAKNEDYAFARGLLKLPSFEGPEIGAALFGNVTIDRFQQALYWVTLARSYAPPGLLPREEPGPKRLRRAGTTVQFVAREQYPRFHLKRADVNVEVGGGFAAGKYALAVSDLTSDPAIVGRPTLFAARRAATGSGLDSLRITGSMDHIGAPRDVASVYAAGLALPAMSLPVLPYRMDPGKGTSEMRFVLDGEKLSGRWALRSTNLAWVADSARAKRLNPIESLVARALTGIHELDLTADIGGTIKAPTLSVRSNLDRQVADRMKAVVGEQVAAATAKVRAQVDRMVEEKSAPVRAKIDSLRTDSEKRLADARTRLDEEKRKLDDRLKSMSGGLVGLPKLPGLE